MKLFGEKIKMEFNWDEVNKKFYAIHNHNISWFDTLDDLIIFIRETHS